MVIRHTLSIIFKVAQAQYAFFEVICLEKSSLYFSSVL